MNILEIKGLRKDFYLHHAQREIHSCENINFSLVEGQFIFEMYSPYLSANRGRYSL